MVRDARALSSTALAAAALARPLGSQEVTAAQIDSIVRRAVAEKGIVGLSVGVMRDGRVILAKGYGVRDRTTNDTVTTAHDVRHRLGDEAVHVLAAPDAGRRASAVAERSCREVRSATHAGEGHHAPRRRRTPLGISRLLSAGFRRPGDAEAAAGGRDHRRVRDASARFRAAFAILVQQHGVPHPRPRDRAGEPRAVRQVLSANGS